MDPGENSINDDNTNNSTPANKEEASAKELQKEPDSKENEELNIVQDQPLDLSMKKPEKKTKRGRRSDDTIAPRRNPQRQAQLNKKPYKLFYDDIWADERAAKAKKAKAAKERTPKKSVRFSTRVQGNCGAVYSPPSPLSQKHMRNWPAEGMHEKPEYDPKTGKMQPLDYVARSIVEDYNKRKSAINGAEADCPGNEVASQISENEDRIDVMTHVVLHRVITYAATALQIEKREKESIKKQYKIQYFNYLGLEPNKNNDDGNDALNDVDTDDIKHNLKELLKDTMIKYCIANEVNQSDLAKYIDSLTSEDISNMSKEQYASSPNQPAGSS